MIIRVIWFGNFQIRKSESELVFEASSGVKVKAWHLEAIRGHFDYSC